MPSSLKIGTWSSHYFDINQVRSAEFSRQDQISVDDVAGDIEFMVQGIINPFI